MDTDRTETVRLTADVVLTTVIDGQTHVLLIRRGWPPFEGMWALPGGHVDPGEAVYDAAARELLEETGMAVDRLAPVAVYTEPGRDPRGRYVTAAWTAHVLDPALPKAGDDASDAAWVPLTNALADRLAFDHHQILTDALTQYPR